MKAEDYFALIKNLVEPEDIEEIIPNIHDDQSTVVWFTNHHYVCSCGRSSLDEDYDDE